jgi:hypothetical protein
MKALGSRAALVACALALPAAAQAAPFAMGDLHAKTAAHPAHTLLGLTSQFPCVMEPSPVCGTVDVSLTRNGKRLKRVSIAYEAECLLPDMYMAQLIDAKGFSGSGRRFSKSGQLRQDLDGGETGVTDITLKGRLKPKRGVASGTFRAVSRIYEAGQEGQLPLDTCDSGSISWRATAARRG